MCAAHRSLGDHGPNFQHMCTSTHVHLVHMYIGAHVLKIGTYVVNLNNYVSPTLQLHIIIMCHIRHSAV